MYAISQAAYAQVQKEGEASNNNQEQNTQSDNAQNNQDDVIDAEYTKE